MELPICYDAPFGAGPFPSLLDGDPRLKLEVKEIDGCRRRIQVEVPADAVETEMEKVARNLSRTVRLPGFRKGKAPVSLVRGQFRKEIHEEVATRLIREYTGKVLEEKKLKPIHDPVLEGYDLREKRPMTFRAVFDILPDIRLSGYRGVLLSPKKPPVTDETVEEALRTLQMKASRYLPVEPRPVVEGDYLVGRVSGRPLGKGGREIEEHLGALSLEDPDLLPEFRTALLGMEPGQERTFSVSYPKDHADPALAGGEIEYRFRLQEIKKRELPPMDDDFAREMGSYENLDELRESVLKQLRESAGADWRRSARLKIIDHLLDGNAVEIPRSLLEAETHSRVEAVLRERATAEWDTQKLESLWKEEWEKQRPLAERAVRGRMLLDAVARQEKITPNQEQINERLSGEAARRKTTVASLKEEIGQKSGWNELEGLIRRELVLDFLLENANIS